jgi:putative phage-type endonuclease
VGERGRANGVTASEAAVILGRSPYQTPWRLWAERTGLTRPADLSANPHVQRGIALEDAARRAFEERHDTLLLALCGESETHPVLRASFDGIADDGAPVELKVPSERTFADVQAKGTEAPAYALYWPQLQHQLYVADAARGWLVFYGGQGRLLELAVERDESFLTGELVPGCLTFWEALDDLLKENKTDLDRAETALVAMMGDFLAAETAGLRVTRYQQSGSVDYKAALAAFVPQLEESALEAYRRKGSDRVRITPIDEEDEAIPMQGMPVDSAGQPPGAQSFFF